MADGRFVSYLRVSTEKQGRSGLGIEAQRKSVTDFLNGGSWSLITEVVEHESGKRADRPKLTEALRLCRLHNATLVIARLDRLSRDAAFLLNLQNAGVRFIAADMPEANEMVVGIMGIMAQAERKRISTNTKLALAAAKARGVRLGGDRGVVPSTEAQAKGGAATKAKAMNRAADLVPVIAAIRQSGTTTLNGIADALNAQGIPTAKGGTWSATQVSRVEKRAP
ncbi:resolvase [Methylobacterium sp. WL64]|uniref:recombinase family protein n=1 Tax=Methylobacterium sp. WL64 TaxID=2603894 RepID=UPI0011CCBC7F|nr:recombinase family protein [Methylobacterium sp. WL64]TXN04195.1 resolvase [Methylobacterium sp. WL64]